MPLLLIIGQWLVDGWDRKGTDLRESIGQFGEQKQQRLKLMPKNGDNGTTLKLVLVHHRISFGGGGGYNEKRLVVVVDRPQFEVVTPSFPTQMNIYRAHNEIIRRRRAKIVLEANYFLLAAARFQV